VSSGREKRADPRAAVEWEVEERPKARLPLKASQVGEEKCPLGCAQRVEAELKEMNKSMENLHLRKSPDIEGFCKVLGFQEETGRFIKRELPDHAMVISQGWPSWTFALEGLGFCSVSTITSFDSPASKAEFQATEMGSTLVSKEELSPWLDRNDVKGMIFVQGEQCSTYEFGSIMRILFVCSNVSFTSKDSLQVSHSNAGGVTDGEWLFYRQVIPLELSKV